MAGIVIVAHAPLATALKSVARHVFAERADAVTPIDVIPEWTCEQAERVIRNAVEQVSADKSTDVLILTDVFGATPCNAAQRVANGQRVRLLAGVNVPMLWRALSYSQLPLDELVERALAGGAQGVMPATPNVPQTQSLLPRTDDSSKHHDQ